MILGASLLVGIARPAAAEKGGFTPPAPDRIDVIAHFPLSGGPVTHLTVGAHWQNNYLYLDRGGESPVSILDVTNPAAPAAAGELDVPKEEAGGKLSAVVGTAALIASSPSAAAQQATKQIVTILSFADPEHPTVVRQFPGVTAMLKDTSRDLIYLINSDGLWVLRVEPATDVQLEKQYARYVLYNR
jgi:hypothetical protein